MLGVCEFSRLESMERAALERRQVAWAVYTNTRRRFEEAYDSLLSAQDDFEYAKNRSKRGDGVEVMFKLAEKRRRSAREEFQYQKTEWRRAKAEFVSARNEYWYWRERSQKEVTVGNSGQNVDFVV